MYLDEVWIGSEEIERIICREGQLELELRWSLEELPVLFDLPAEPLLRWHADDPEAGITLACTSWRFEREGSRVRLYFRC